ncbi:hypothetical protein RHCRD62_10078 [Rhodococcus sp. RD6.2]|uniref:bifunctional DNA primase/polymerase n=1 Tax=Rhodococcus sp. RD6.2 TaxID=260936 RepID=UPI00063BB104|nr:bifunctional DNA primase/polymerase [Rhodococcus sp. RD6.2]CRK49223.1 hypothetical protein RHCRD62_10078 [Rhodococcus sp. RD6.2]
MSYSTEVIDRYWRAGYCHVMPLPKGSKSSPPKGYTGYGGAVPSRADCEAWIEGYPDGNVAVRLPGVPGDEYAVIGIDVDHYGDKSGAVTLAHAEKVWGALPPTVRSTSRGTGNPSGIRLYRVPAGVGFVTVLAFRELGLGHIEIIQWFHRYMVVSPSAHPSGGVYQWIDADGKVVDGPPSVESLPMLPDTWVEGLRAGARSSVTTSVADVPDILAGLPGGEPSAKVRGRLDEAMRDLRGRAGSRHDSTLRHVLALFRLAEQGAPGVPAALTALSLEWMQVMGPIRGVEAAQAEWNRMVCGQRGHDLLASTPSADPAAETADLLRLADDDVTVLPTEARFWTARPELERIQRQAHARVAAPWAVLGVALCRVAALIPITVELPAISGGPMQTNLLVALVGRPGEGKGVAGKVAKEMIPLNTTLVEETGGPGSGEGITRSYGHMEKVKEGSTVVGMGWVWRNPNHASLFWVDEVTQLKTVSARSGNTVVDVLRTAVTGGSLKVEYADPAKRNGCGDGTYRFAGVMCAQPTNLGWVMDDEDGGLPQRVLFFKVIDPTIPDLADPVPAFDLAWPETVYAGVFRFPSQIVAEIRAEQLSIRRYGAQGLDGHSTATRMKVAALLRVFHVLANPLEYAGRPDNHAELFDVTAEDWELAGVVMRHSDSVRAEVQAAIGSKAGRDNASRGKAEAERDLARAEHLERHSANQVEAKLRKVFDGGKEFTHRDVARLFDSSATGKAHRSAIPGVLVDMVGREVLAAVSRNRSGKAVYRLVE